MKKKVNKNLVMILVFLILLVFLAVFSIYDAVAESSREELVVDKDMAREFMEKLAGTAWKLDVDGEHTLTEFEGSRYDSLYIYPRTDGQGDAYVGMNDERSGITEIGVLSFNTDHLELLLNSGAEVIFVYYPEGKRTEAMIKLRSSDNGEVYYIP